jgi:hypothetical protein
LTLSTHWALCGPPPPPFGAISMLAVKLTRSVPLGWALSVAAAGFVEATTTAGAMPSATMSGSTIAKAVARPRAAPPRRSTV